MLSPDKLEKENLIISILISQGNKKTKIYIIFGKNFIAVDKMSYSQILLYLVPNFI